MVRVNPTKNLNPNPENEIVRSRNRILTFRVDVPRLEVYGTGRVSLAADYVSLCVPRRLAP